MFRPVTANLACTAIVAFLSLTVVGSPTNRILVIGWNAAKATDTAFAETEYVIHDLAVVGIQAPVIRAVNSGEDTVSEVVSVGIQNRSDHDEVFDPEKHLGNGITSGLVRLRVEVIDDDNEGCEPAKVGIRPPAPLTKWPTLSKPTGGFGVLFDVTLRCKRPKPQDRKDPTPWDYSYFITVHHEVLDGKPDSDPSDDVCPRQPILPKRGIEDRGCGRKLRGQPLGPYVTNIILKSPTKP